MNKQDDFIQVVDDLFIKEGQELTHRYRSFDFCYTHFHPTNKNRENIQESCFVLWGYLASWGMLRGSSFLLGKNPAYLKPLVEFIIKLDKSYWQIDIENYPDNYGKIIDLYKKITRLIIEDDARGLTLVTKILLGVFAVVPAYDSYFCKTFRLISEEANKKDKNHKYCGFTQFNQHSLEVIYEFYSVHKSELVEIKSRVSLLNFDGSENKHISYTFAKIIDMYGFAKDNLTNQKEIK